MINNFKPFKISEKDINNLKNVSPYWEKDIKKNVKRLKIWLIKFNKNLDNFKLEYTTDYNKYIEFFQQIDNYSNFYNQKFKLINSNLRLLSKFHKLIVDYVSLLGWAKSIELLCVYFNDIENKNIGKKQEYALELVNDCIMKYFELFRKEVSKIIKKDEYIDLLSEKVFSSKEVITNIDFVVREIMKYCRMLKKKNKIAEQNLIDINILSIEIIVFSNSITRYYSRFLSNVY
ncbi:hypothetical protein [Spiroplasma floricola]|uniref:Uncharacterized protein n=1 Tax=Spiroplasma floricola 23-6 TaxID=1336749 RepID=A0A2K8SE50_9MOLU|nr:hypothetical protein [Spiroplasma floricola]AUB31508.1 hypothetical protein SFLOR_v1c04560 [Spiroplasma floricola 23-6]